MAAATLAITAFIAYTIAVLVWAYFLTVGAKWARVEGVGLSRALFISLVVHTAAFALAFYFGVLIPSMYELNLMIVALFLAAFIGQLVFIAWAIRSSFYQAFKTWLPTLFTNIVNVVLALLIKLFVLESFVIPTCSMAPTIVGVHEKVICPTCNAEGYGDPPLAQFPQISNQFICDNFHRWSSEERSDQTIGPADRLIANKLMRPKRWDAIVFRFPEDRRVNYVKRLVGLPGETIRIKDGGVWINGERLKPPASLENISYTSEFHGRPIANGATPITLGDDEHFVLGDFTTRSKDARLWTKNELRPHAPYAVIASEIIGVATHTYGARWKSLEP